MLRALARLAPFARASRTTRIDVEATRGSDATWTAQTFDDLAREGYEQAVWAYAAIRQIQAQVKYTRPLLQRRGRGGNLDEIDQHPLLDLLKQPNEEQSLADFLEGLAGYYLVGGNAYIEGVATSDKAPPAELWLKRPDRVRIIPNAENRIGGYRYTVGGRSIDFEPWEIQHLKTWAPLSDWYGLSPLSAAARGVDLFNAGQAHNLALLQNGARPTGAWVTTGTLEPRQRQRIREELLEAAQIGRRGRTLIMEGGVKWEELGVTPKDLDFLAGQVDAARQIHAAFGVHPVLTGLEAGTFENQEQALRGLVLLVVFPWLEQVFERLNRWIVPRYGEGLVLTFDRDAFPAISEDQDSLWERATTGWAKGILTRNEARSLIGYDEVPEAERGEVFVSELYGRVPVSTVLPTETGTPAAGTPAAAGEDEGEDEAGTSSRAALPAPTRTRYRRAFHLETELDRSMYWRSRVDLQVAWEARALERVHEIFELERGEIVERMAGASTEADLMLAITLTVADTRRWDALTPVLLAAMVAGGESVLDRLETDEARARRSELLNVPLAREVFGLVFEETLEIALAHMPKLVGEISETTLQRAAGKIAQGASEGLSVPGIASLIDDLYLEEIIPNRSTVIARTEIIRSTNFGGQQAARATGLNLNKTWIATRDGREREAHGAADGQTVPIDGTYTVDFEPLSYPGDPRGSASNVIQCRCSEFYTEVDA